MKPFAPEYCRAGDHTIAYRELGRGDVVLLVHGITTYSFIWRKIIPLLEDNYRVIAIDLPGCGASSKSIEKTYSIKQHASSIKRFLDAKGVSRIHLVGHDVGGGICQIFAVNHTKMCKTLTLINSVGYDFWPVQPIIAMRTPIIRQLAMATLNKSAMRLIISRGLYHKNVLDSELLNLFWEPMKTSEGRKAFLHFAKSLDIKDLLEIEDELHRIVLPTLLIRGERDPYLSGIITEKLVKNLRQAKLVSIDTGSHFIQEDEPGIISRELNLHFTNQDNG